jgi:hypothetical protein
MSLLCKAGTTCLSAILAYEASIIVDPALRCFRFLGPLQCREGERCLGLSDPGTKIMSNWNALKPLDGCGACKCWPQVGGATDLIA